MQASAALFLILKFVGAAYLIYLGVRMLLKYPGLTIAKVRNALPFAADMVERIVDGLRQAGLPE